jgi:signal transduction histidine kinase
MTLRSAGIPWRRRWRKALARHAAWLGAVLAAVVALGVLAALANDLRAGAPAAAERQLQQLAQALAFPLAEAVSGADALLGRLAEAQSRTATEASRAIVTALDDNPGTWLRVVAVMDRSGRILASSDETDLGTDLAAEAFGPWPTDDTTVLGPRIAAHRLADLRTDSGAAAGPPGQGSTVLLRRAWHAEHGEVLLVGLFAVEGLVIRLQSLVLPRDVGVAIVDYAGNLLAASEVTGGEPRALAPFTRFLPRFESGQWQGEGLWDGARIGAFRGASSLPLVLWVEGSREAAMSAWPRQARMLAAVAAILTAALGAGLFAVRWRRRIVRQAGVDRDPPLPAADAVADSSLGAALARLPLCLFRTDPRGVVTSMTPSLEALLAGASDLPADEVLWSRLPADTAAAARRWYRGLEAATAAAPVPWLASVALPDTQGAVRVHRICLSPLIMAGRVQAVFGCVVAEPGPAAAAVEAELQALRSRVAMTEVLVREIRQPLQTILGWSELGHARGPAAGAPADVYARILGASCRIQALVDDLSADGGAAVLAATLELRSVDLRSVAAQVFAGLQPLVQVRGLDLRLEQDDGPLRAMVDPQALQHALATLVLHALDGALDSQGVTISTGRNGSEEAFITVRDCSGRRLGVQWGGLYAGRPGRAGGSADLDACRRIVTAHGGRIHATGSQDQGLVRIIMPLVAARPARA